MRKVNLSPTVHNWSTARPRTRIRRTPHEWVCAAPANRDVRHWSGAPRPPMPQRYGSALPSMIGGSGASIAISMSSIPSAATAASTCSTVCSAALPVPNCVRRSASTATSTRAGIAGASGSVDAAKHDTMPSRCRSENQAALLAQVQTHPFHDGVARNRSSRSGHRQVQPVAIDRHSLVSRFNSRSSGLMIKLPIDSAPRAMRSCSRCGRAGYPDHNCPGRNVSQDSGLATQDSACSHR